VQLPSRNEALVAVALVLIVVLGTIGGWLLLLCLGLARGAWWLLGDRLTGQGNRMHRLSQRLSDALERLDSAIRICMGKG
jgi:hypothetical protein